MTKRETSTYLALDRARDALRAASAFEATTELTPLQREILRAMSAVEAAVKILGGHV